jgi:Uma2 family endonuclease
MMAIPAAKQRYTVSEYIAFEESSDIRHEYLDGEILAMAGGSFEHSIISVNIAAEIRFALKGKPCRVAESNLRVRTPRYGRYVYPDAQVFCGPPKFDTDDLKHLTILNPRVVIEVLSPTTEAYDRGDKFSQYREIESFEEYILISQDRPNFESILRQSDGAWSFQTHSGLETAAIIRCLNVQIPMAEIYAGIEWPTPATAEIARRETND